MTNDERLTIRTWAMTERRMNYDTTTRLRNFWRLEALEKGIWE